MTTIFVIPAAPTTWDAQMRLESASGAPLTAEAVEIVRAAGAELARSKIKSLYCSAGESERQCAALLGELLDAKVRTQKDLREVDYGMWQGLTLDEIRRRQPKVYKQWRETPASLCPPSGETLAEVQSRLRAVVGELTRRHKGDAIALVLRPVAMELVCRMMDGRDLTDFWSFQQRPPLWDSYEMDVRTI